MQGFYQTLYSSSIYTRCAIYWSSQIIGHIECFEARRKSTQMALYNNFGVRCSSFSKISYRDPLRIKMRKQFYSSLSSNSQSIFSVHAFSKYQPSFATRSCLLSADCWKMCGLRWLLRCSMRIDNHGDASWGSEKAKNYGVKSGEYSRWGDSSTLVFLRYSRTCSMGMRWV